MNYTCLWLILAALIGALSAQLNFDDTPDYIAGDELEVQVIEFDVDGGDDLQTDLIIAQVLKSQNLDGEAPVRFRRSTNAAIQAHPLRLQFHNKLFSRGTNTE